jgi:UDP-glucose 4-epimerase
MKFLVTGGAGFIGSNLVDRLLKAGHDVVAYDSLITGFQEFLKDALQSPKFKFVQNDVLDTAALAQAMKGCDFVFHLSANADVRFGTKFPKRDFDHNTTAAFSVLEAMRQAGVRRIGFSSTGAIYGDTKVIPTPEDAPFPIQTSLYGAAKLAGEGMIQAYVAGFGFQGFIFRFVSILGERYHHGHIFDFYKKLRADPTKMDVLGNGKQKKSYLYVQDCFDAILIAIEKAQDKLNIFNLGADEYSDVDQSIAWICERLNIQPKLTYAGGDRGWIGDSPMIYLDCRRMKALGWKPKTSIREGVHRTLDYLVQNSWVVDVERKR